MKIQRERLLGKNRNNNNRNFKNKCKKINLIDKNMNRLNSNKPRINKSNMKLMMILKDKGKENRSINSTRVLFQEDKTDIKIRTRQEMIIPPLIKQGIREVIEMRIGGSRIKDLLVLVLNRNIIMIKLVSKQIQKILN